MGQRSSGDEEKGRPLIERAVVIGAGVGGLCAAIDLAVQGFEVTVVERGTEAGGKLRPARFPASVPAHAPKHSQTAAVDVGPTVFTMRWVFEELFARAGARLDDYLTLRPAEVLARHAWLDSPGGSPTTLDLFADIDRSAEAIAALSGHEEAERFRLFYGRTRRTYDTLREPFLCTPRPTPFTLTRHVLSEHPAQIPDINPFVTMWRALSRHFRDPRLRQLFGRYATYCGSSPFLAPATLMLVAHVEKDGVWLVDGGMTRLATALTELGAHLGVAYRYGVEARTIQVADGAATGIWLTDGDTLDADVLVFNGDAAALSAGLLGGHAARSVPAAPLEGRSLSAVTWGFVGHAHGFDLPRHTVFFSTDYAAEFTALTERQAIPDEPTIYVCAQDRDASSTAEPIAGAPTAEERFLVLINAPSTGDGRPLSREEIERCERTTFSRLAAFGLTLEPRSGAMLRRTPTDFDALYPATGGALYGQATHGWMASFRRPRARTHLANLYLAGGSAHPGPGVPMAALSGRLAVEQILQDRASTQRFHPVAMSGGISTH